MQCAKNRPKSTLLGTPTEISLPNTFYVYPTSLWSGASSILHGISPHGAEIKTLYLPLSRHQHILKNWFGPTPISVIPRPCVTNCKLSLLMQGQNSPFQVEGGKASWISDNSTTAISGFLRWKFRQIADE